MEPVAVGSPALPGLLTLPKPGYGIILFAHGTDGSRLSPRNRHVAAELHKAGFGTLLFDLLTEEEAFRRANVFDIPLLASRLLMATEWLDERDDLRCAPFGYFGASTGAAAALLAAGEAKHGPSAIGSRGGRPDLAAHALERVAAPVLLIVGGADREVLMLNRRTFAELPGEKEIAVLPGSGHLFEERSALDQVVALALRWFERYLHQPHIPESRLDGDRLAPSAAE